MLSDSQPSIEALLWCNDRLFSSGLHGLVVEHDLERQRVRVRHCDICCSCIRTGVILQLFRTFTEFTLQVHTPGKRVVSVTDKHIS